MRTFERITLVFAFHFIATWLTAIAGKEVLHSKPMGKREGWIIVLE